MTEELFVIPASFAQERLWFLAQLESNSSNYNLAAAFHLEGLLEIASLARSLNEIVRRHEALRTAFGLVDGEPVQLIAPTLELELPVIDLQPWAKHEREQRLRELSAAEARRPFNLHEHPLFRATLLRLDEGEHVLLMTVHHIIADAWSVGILLRELSVLYNAYQRGEEAPFSDLTVQYADYAVWQRQQMTGAALDQDLEYWKQELAGAPPVLELSGDPTLRTPEEFTGAREPITLSKELSDAVRTRSRDEGVTLFMTLLASFTLLLQRYRGENDILVGTPIAGRTSSETQHSIGCFVNTLVLRTRLSNNPTFRELLAQVRKTAIAAYAHQELPFEKLVEHLQPERSLTYSPLFQVMFSLNSTPQEELQLAGLRVKPFELDVDTAKFDLTLNLVEQNGTLTGSFNYNKAVIVPEVATRMAAHWQHLLSSVVADPSQRIDDVAMLDAKEVAQILWEWNATAAAYGADTTIHELFAQQAARTPEAIAVACGEERLSYGELEQRSNQLARHLRRLGVGAEARVGICVERSLAMVVGLLGILKAGGAYVPLDPAYPAERLQYMLADAGVKVLLTQPGLRASLPETNAVVVCLDGGWDELEPESGAEVEVKLEPENLAYVIYTSGSTGRPKGVLITHGAVTNHLSWRQQAYPLGPSDRFLQKASLSFDISVWEIFAPLLAGAQLVLAEPGGERDSAYLVRTIAAQQITQVHFGPALLQVVLQESGVAEWGRLQHVFCGGEPLSRELQAEFQERVAARLHHQYGPTETTIDVCIWDCGGAAEWERVPIGRPIANTELYILDERQGLVPVGVSGELYVGGVSLARGYLHSAGLTAERFVPHPFSAVGGARLYRTGDLARYRASGEIEFLGRLDQQLKIRGYRVEPSEIETVLAGHESVQEAAVCPSAGMDALVAYVVPKIDRADLSTTDLRNYLTAKLPSFMVPSSYVLIEKMPLTPNGKIDRAALESLEHVPEAIGPDEPLTPIESLLSSIWAGLLDLEVVRATDNFFNVGGHSLLAMRLMSRIRESFNVEVPLRSLFERPTLAELARTIEETMRQGSRVESLPLMPAPPEVELPLSYAQQRLWFLDQLQPGSSFYNLAGAVRLTGPLNVPALKESLQNVISRHEVLRLKFESEGGRPRVSATPLTDVELPIVDLQSFSEDEREAQALRLIKEESQQPFDLTRGPMFRVQLLRLNLQSHLFLVTMHHIVADAWSTNIFIGEVTQGYQAASGGTAGSLPELEIQYTDYAYWQQQRLRSDVLKEDLSYWREQLSGMPPALELPFDRPRPPVQTFRGTLRSFTLSPNLINELDAFSRREEVTLFMTLLSAFNILMARYSGQRDIVVGTPTAGRTHAATETLIGLFLNMLVLRTDMHHDPTVSELLKRVREVALGAYMHQEVPFERLVEELQPERNLSHSPLFQVMFSLANTQRQTLKLTGLEIAPVDIQSNTAKYDLSFVLEEHESRLQLYVEYNTDLFDDTTITRMVMHYERLLNAMLAEPTAPISKLTFLDPEELDQILFEWNTTAQPFSDASLPELFAAQAARIPETIAVVYEDEQLNYGELNRRSNQLADYLRRRSVGPEVMVGICLERSLEMVVGLLGVLKAGGAYVPIDPQYPKERVQYMLADAGVKILLTQRRLRASLPETNAAVVCLDADWHEIEQRSGADVVISPEPENLAYVIYTSGSTGRPKGVTVTHRNVANFFAGMDQRIGLNGEKCWLAVTSISFDISVLELLWTLTRGFKVVIQTEQNRLLAGKTNVIEKRMEFSFFYFASEENRRADSYRLLIEGAKFADRNGFTAVWTPERHFHAFGGLYPNPAITSAAIATITQRIQIRAGSVVLPLHDPLLVAEDWAMVDNLSSGRVAISFASGWHANDFVLSPDVYGTRHEVMYRQIETVRKLWRGESIVRRSGGGNEIEVTIHPQPVQPELPVWITAAGNSETFKSAGRLGANLLTHLLGQTIEELAGKISAYRGAWREDPKRKGDGHVTLMLHTFISDDFAKVRRMVHQPFTDYLRTSVDLLRTSARSLGRDLDSESLNEQDMQAILTHAFDRYFETSALLGTPETTLEMIERLKSIGVDEVACLIDFGVADEEVLASLPHLNKLREHSNRTNGYAQPVYSISEQIQRHRVTHLQCTPSLMKMLMSEPESVEALKTLQHVLVGGEALPVTLAQQLRQTLPGTLHNMYGPTETTVWSTSHKVDEVGDSISIGKPIANTTIRILDEHGLPVPIGVVGELYIGGTGVVRGYLHLPALTAEKLVPDPFAAELGARMYRTGDLARYLPDGNIEFHGRVDHQIKIGGHRIEAGEIETVLRQYPGVNDAVVTARAVTGENLLLAYVVPDNSRQAVTLQMVPASEAKRLLGDRSHFTMPNGMTIAHSSGHRVTMLYREIFANESYLRNGITLHDGDCVFDVGANVGMFTLFANQKRRNLKSFVFEPIPTTFDFLRTNVALYNLDAKLFNTGVSNKKGFAEFTFYPRMPGLSGRSSTEAADKQTTKAIIESYLQDQGTEEQRAILSDDELDRLMEDLFVSETYKCSLTTLSDVISEYQIDRIDLLKIDVEKSELDVLSGLRPADWAKVKQIVIEVDSRDLLDQITTLLELYRFDFTVEEIVRIEKNTAGVELNFYMLYATSRDRSVPHEVQNDATTNGDLSISQLRSYLQRQLPTYMIPASITLLPELPRTPNGKIDFRALPQGLELPPELSTAYVSPETNAERVVAQSWREVLRVEQVGVNDNFFEAGGTSLRLVEVNSKLREAFKRSIPIVEMFRYPTIRELARFLDAPAEIKPAVTQTQERASRRAGAASQRRESAQAKQQKKRAAHEAGSMS